jgi:methionyl-tRNA formyltransferase
MGTPDFAVEPLKKLLEAGYKVVAVVTNPDKPAGRGKKLKASPVKEFAFANNLPVIQPEKLKNNEALVKQLTSLRPDLQIVVAFRLLPKAIWEIPKKGTVNLHASLLPQYRGAAPINWAIINGEEKSGVTTFFIDEKMDTGKIIMKKEVSVRYTDNAGDLHDKLMFEGANLVVETARAIVDDDIQPLSQSELTKNQIKLKKAPKIHKDDCRINWDSNVEAVYNFIRGLSPWPGAWTELKEPDMPPKYVKIFAAMTEECKHDHTPGTIRTDNKAFIKVAVQNGYLVIKNLQLSGKKRLDTEDFLRGYQLVNNSVFV